jgi:hypothetical protein
MVISLTANKVSDPTFDASIPIVDVKKRDYIHTARGVQSLEYLLLVARSHLIARSRTVEIKFRMLGFVEALRLRSLRKSVLLHDHRLPGGQAVGKITSVTMSLDGDQGEPIFDITIACCVGKGGSHTTAEGDPTYVEDDYVESDYQEYEGVIAWSIPVVERFDDDIDFERGLTAMNAVKLLSIANSAETQRAAILAASDGPLTDQAKISQVLKELPTQITAQMIPMEGGPFQQVVTLEVSDLVIPKQIDLEAPSNA